MTSSAQRESALDFLYGRINFERTSTIPYQTNVFKLDRMRRLLESLGNPHLGLNVVHLAGTKGKGSTANMIGSIALQAGFSVGQYTSPHLERLEERFVVNGANIREQRLIDLADRLRDIVTECDAYSESIGERGVTFFELTTALALLEFAEQKVELAVLEVGLGGRLDSTNVCQPLVCGITSISYDHTKQLGNTLAAIAREKAGIIKPGVPVVSGVTEAEAALVIREIAELNNAPSWVRGVDFDYEVTAAPVQCGPQFSYVETREGGVHWKDLKVAMLGRHQAANAATAVAIVRRLQELGWKISEADIRAGLLTSRMPARVEVIPATGDQPTIIVDAAHNIASVSALLETLNEHFPLRPRALIFATSKDKDAAGMLQKLLPQFETVFVTQYCNNPRFTEVEELRGIADDVVRQERLQTAVVRCDTPLAAWREMCRLVPQPNVVVVAGSFFLAAELMPLIRG